MQLGEHAWNHNFNRAWDYGLESLQKVLLDYSTGTRAWHTRVLNTFRIKLLAVELQSEKGGVVEKTFRFLIRAAGAGAFPE